MVYLPCGHVCICQGCAQRSDYDYDPTSRCPNCNQFCDDLVQLYNVGFAPPKLDKVSVKKSKERELKTKNKTMKSDAFNE